MNDFVGPSRFQWPDQELAIVDRVRGILPDRFLVHPRAARVRLERSVDRPTLEHMQRTDPTEAADSAAIVPSVLRCFPDAEIVPTGGVIYHLALNDVLANFVGEEDAALLRSLLLADELLARGGSTHYAVALAVKG